MEAFPALKECSFSSGSHFVILSKTGRNGRGRIKVLLHVNVWDLTVSPSALKLPLWPLWPSTVTGTRYQAVRREGEQGEGVKRRMSTWGKKRHLVRALPAAQILNIKQ